MKVHASRISAKEILCGFMLVTLILFGLSCSNDSPQEATVSETVAESGSDGFPRSIQTIDGEIVVPEKPRRIVSQTLLTDEVLLEICPTDRLVGIHTVSLDPAFSNCLELAEPLADRAVNGTEAIISLEPDLVFVASFSRAEVIDQLQAGCEAPIVRFSDFDNLDQIRNNIEMTGYLIGEETATEVLVDKMDTRIREAVSRIPKGATPPKVVSFGPASYTAGGGTLFDDILKTIGAVNLAAVNGVDRFGQIGTEQVAFWNPDWVICGVDPGAEESTRDWFFENPVLQATRAGREDHLLLVPNRLYTAASQHVADLVELLVEEIYLTEEDQ